MRAGVAQLAEQLTCNQQVVRSIRIAGSISPPRYDPAMDTLKQSASSPDPPTSASTKPDLALIGFLLVLPALIFWALLFLLEPLGLQEMVVGVVRFFGAWFVIIVLMAMPLAGGILGALGFRRRRVLATIAVVLGFGFTAISVLFQTAPQRTDEGQPATAKSAATAPQAESY